MSKFLNFNRPIHIHHKSDIENVLKKHYYELTEAQIKSL